MDEPVEHLLRDPVKPGRRLGSNYLVGERLGRGAMGVVHEATTNDGMPMAVKFLRAELASDHKTVARFLQERQIFRKINHPNVVRVHDLVAEGDDLAIVMERVSGGDLKQRIENRSLSPRQSLLIASGIAAGLSAIHGVSVIHRDLKPANILLTDELSPKISDFGISRLVTEAMTRTSATIGTPIYMAPEAADARGADAPADVYALGIMLFELLVGRPPFSQGGTFAVLRAHAMDVPPRLEGVPAQLTELIARMLAKDPAQRPTVVEVERHLVALVPHVGDDVTPAAVPPVGGSDMDVDSGELTGPEVGERISSDRIGAAGGVAAAAWAAADSSETVVSHPGADSSGGAWESPPTETAISQDPVVSGDPVPGLAGGIAGAAAAGAAGAASAGTDATLVTPGGGVHGAGAGAGQGGAGFAGLGGDPSSTGPDGVPFVASHAPDGARRTGGAGSLFPNRIPRRIIEIGAAVGSLAAVLIVVALVMSSGGDDGDGSGIASGGVSTTAPAGPGLNPDGGEDGGQGPTEFTSNIDLGDDEDDGEGTPTTGGPSTSAGQGDPSSTTGSTSSTTGSSTSTSASTTSTTGPTTSSTISTTTTRPTTTTTRPTTTTSSTTTTTAPPAVQIRIVSGPSIQEVNPTSFRFTYTTNDVCGTGSFSVSTLGGTSVGSFSGDNICFGPGHGGFPGLQSSANFRHFNLEPGTTYRVSITVRGTASDGTRTAGSGSDSTSFQVTTAG